ncbi:DNA-binding protein [Klebsiella pneumoniae]|nr:DNA-binding protein [Klebsiella pneumoniae]
MSKKIIDWDTLKTELLGQPEVQAAFDAQERQQRLRTMLAQWREQAGANPSPGGAEDGGECANGLQNGSQYHPRQSGYLNAIRVSLRYKAPASFTLLTRSLAIHLPAQINDRSHGP